MQVKYQPDQTLVQAAIDRCNAHVAERRIRRWSQGREPDWMERQMREYLDEERQAAADAAVAASW
jgi:hypothetical protein